MSATMTEARADPRETTEHDSPSPLEQQKEKLGYASPRYLGSPSPSTTSTGVNSPSSVPRKRSILDHDEGVMGRSRSDLRINTGSSFGNDQLVGFYRCECPKIPRPPNPYILYRQHRHAEVAAEHAELNNPGISSFVGKEWNELSEADKAPWKEKAKLAGEEHQRKYPGYRYKPRRRKPNAPGPDRCDDCGGILPPRTKTPTTAAPRTPASTLTGIFPGTPLTNMSDESSPRYGLHARYDPTWGSPYAPQNATPTPTRASFGERASGMEVDERQLSPDFKRRRMNATPGYQQMPLPGGSQIAQARPPPSPFDRGQYDQARQYMLTPQSEPSTPIRSGYESMPPPPRPTGRWTDPGRGAAVRHRGYEEVGPVKLPPMRAVPPSPLRSSLGDISTARGLEDIKSPSSSSSDPNTGLTGHIMSMSAMKKLDVLGRICQPIPALANPPSTSQVRGALIALEGQDEDMLSAVGAMVEKSLKTCAGFDVRFWTGGLKEDDGRSLPGDEPDIETAAAGRPFAQQYFQTVMEWQDRCRQIFDFVTKGAESRNVSTPVDAEASTDLPLRVMDTRRDTPVAVVNNGFSLTISNRFACQTPVADDYKPADHWQWMAGLWRGTPCPDLVVYVVPATEEEIRELGAVEIQKQMGLIIVRGRPGKVSEATERRLVFEIGEWLREGSYRERKPSNWRRCDDARWRQPLEAAKGGIY